MRHALPIAEAPSPETALTQDVRVVRVGLLGLGNVGQALVRVCRQYRAALLARGLDLRITGVLVRDIARPRRSRPDDALVTAYPAEFLAQPYDVVIEVLGGVEPAGTFVGSLLRSRVPVVTANKSLLAVHGATLRQLAAEHGTPLRVEAAAIAGVPFVGTHATRPLAGRITRLVGILNGTSNYILSAMAESGATYAAALANAQELGYAEPDPANDVEGVDAAEKLAVLLGSFGVASVDAKKIDRAPLSQVTAGDFAAARQLGGVLKPVACASIHEGQVAAFVSPAFVPAGHALAQVRGVQNAVALTTDCFGELFYAGPGAGPEVTAATIIDDVVEAVTSGAASLNQETPPGAVSPEGACTPWFVRLQFAGDPPPTERIFAFLGSHGVWPRQSVVGSPGHAASNGAGRCVYLLTCATRRATISAALAALEHAACCSSAALRVLE